MAHFYTLHSEKLNKYYIGHTTEPIEERLRKHNSYHNGFTGRANDWKIKYSETYDSKTLAFARELEVKAWKSRKLIERLVGSMHPD